MSKKVVSLKILGSGERAFRHGKFFLGKRDPIDIFAMVRRKRNRKPRERVAHANPTRGKSVESMDGKIMPPMEPPQLAIPEAKPRRRRKKWPTEAMAGEEIKEVPRPPRMENERMKWWYSGREDDLVFQPAT